MLKNKFLTHFGTYLGASVFNRALPFFLLPVLTRYLTPSEYGILAIYQVTISFFTPIVGMNMSSNITRNFFIQNQEEIAKLISNLLIVLSVTFSISMIGLGAYILVFWPISLEIIPDKWLYTIPIIAAMNTINQFNLTIFRNQNNAVVYGVFEIANTALNVGVTLLLVVCYKLGWQGCAGGIFVTSVVFGVISLIYIYQTDFLTLNFDMLTIRQIVIVSFPLLFHALGIVIINLSDRFFIDLMVGKEAVGLYAVGYQFGMIVLFVTDSFNKVWSPWIFTQLSQAHLDKRQKIVKYTYFYNIGILSGAVLFSMFAYFLLIYMTTPAYYNAQEFIIWVALGYAFRGMYTMVFPYLVYVGKTSFLGVITLTSAGVNMIANYVLIEINGTVGAAQATLLSFIVLFLGVWWYANRIYPMPWFRSRLAKLTLI